MKNEQLTLQILDELDFIQNDLQVFGFEGAEIVFNDVENVEGFKTRVRHLLWQLKIIDETTYYSWKERRGCLI